jgi:hypothetical protein
MAKEPENKSEIIFYQTEDGRTRLEVQLLNESVWLSLNQMAELFQRDKSVISKHIKNVFDEGELKPGPTVAKFATVQKVGDREVSREIEFYNLDIIISVRKVEDTKAAEELAATLKALEKKAKKVPPPKPKKRS